jgi:FMN phosphatase YigB (HAD superfamily)
VVFDWGNTLAEYPLRTEPDQLCFLMSCLDDLAAECRLEWYLHLSPAQRADLITMINRENLDHAVLPFQQRIPRRLCDARWLEEELLSRLSDLGKLDTDSAATLDRLQSAGYKTAVLSNAPWGITPDAWRNEIRSKLEIDTVVVCGDVGYRKPDARPFKRSFELLSLEPSEVAVVGDSVEVDVLPSYRLGARAIWFDPFHSASSDYQGGRIANLRDLVSVIGRDLDAIGS